MGNYCGNLYKGKQECPYCKRNKYVGTKETALLISTKGCMGCRLKNKYFMEENNLFSSTDEYIYLTNNGKRSGRYY